MIVHSQMTRRSNFWSSSEIEGGISELNQKLDSAYSDGNKTNYDESICGIASYFCTSDDHNNFTARRPPTFYYDALEKCRIENSSLISSKSATDIALAKKGFKIHRIFFLIF